MRKNASITPLRKRWRFYDAISAITSGSVGGYNIHRARVPCFDILRGPPRPMSGIYARRDRSMRCRRLNRILSPGDCRRRCAPDHDASTGGSTVSCSRLLSAHAFQPAPHEDTRPCRTGSRRLNGRSRRRAPAISCGRGNQPRRGRGDCFFELVQNRIEADEVLQPSIAHDFLRSPQTCCHASNSLGRIW
jgi:hypothetical protein